MSEAKFTKGEWVVSVDGLSVATGGFKVARAFSGSATPYVLQTTKNAHLIAAAPEMYREIEKDINWLERMISTHGDDHPMTPMFEDMKKDKISLIAKARGEHD